jgi:hypothetical protein
MISSGIWRTGLLGVVMGILAACGQGDAPTPSGRSLEAAAQTTSKDRNRPPEIESVTFDPATPRPGARIQARVAARDPDGDAVELRYAWSIDGRPVASDGSHLLVPQSLAKGVPIEVVVVARDGATESEPARARASVGNRPPAILGVYLDPEQGVRVGDSIAAVSEVRDADDDWLEFSYVWFVNGKRADESGERFSTEGLERGDEIRARVWVSDGTERSAPRDSAPVQIGNSAPVILSSPAGLSADGVLRYVLEAEDPDGDRDLRYSLVTGPEGARVDASRGELLWNASSDQVGTHVFEVEVADDHGGRSRQRFEVGVAAPGSNSKTTPAREGGSPASIE